MKALCLCEILNILYKILIRYSFYECYLFIFEFRDFFFVEFEILYPVSAFHNFGV